MLLQLRRLVVAFCFCAFCRLETTYNQEIANDETEQDIHISFHEKNKVRGKPTTMFLSSSVLASDIALACSAIPWVSFFIIALVKSSMVLNLHHPATIKAAYLVLPDRK